MKVINIKYWLDGGSIGINTDVGLFCIDKRIRTKTPKMIYYNYPDNLDARVATDDEKNELIEALTKKIDESN